MREIHRFTDFEGVSKIGREHKYIGKVCICRALEVTFSKSSWVRIRASKICDGVQILLLIPAPPIKTNNKIII